MTLGVYTDRRGRRWVYMDYNTWITDRTRWATEVAGSKYIRWLIRRDQHRDACPGLSWCLTHPAVNADYDRLRRMWDVWGPGDWFRGSFGTHAEAMDAARALAVGQ